MARTSRRVLSATIGAVRTERPSICASCLRRLIQRRHASAASAPTASDRIAAPEVITADSQRQAAAAAYKQEYKVQCGIVLSRPPQITRDLTPFEKAFFLYQRRLNERLTLPFQRYQYFTKNTPVFKEWQRGLKERLTPAHEIGRYNAYDREGWNDEVLVGATDSETQTQVDAMLAEAGNDGAARQDGSTAAGQIIERPAPRRTAADEAQDQQSLNRSLQESLYLMVQTTDGRWTFPTGTVEGREGLREAAERILFRGAGHDMNTWFVGNAPIGLYKYDYPRISRDENSKVSTLGEKVFFMKARIAAGQVQLNAEQSGWRDFRWLSKDEVQSVTTRQYWSDIRRMLPSR